MPVSSLCNHTLNYDKYCIMYILFLFYFLLADIDVNNGYI